MIDNIDPFEYWIPRFRINKLNVAGMKIFLSRFSGKYHCYFSDRCLCCIIFVKNGNDISFLLRSYLSSDASCGLSHSAATDLIATIYCEILLWFFIALSFFSSTYETKCVIYFFTRTVLVVAAQLLIFASFAADISHNAANATSCLGFAPTSTSHRTFGVSPVTPDCNNRF